MSQFSYYLLTLPYNSVFSVLLLNTIKYRRSAYSSLYQKVLMEEHWRKQFENHSKCSRKLSLEHLWKFQSEWSDIVLKDTSKGMKCLMALIKLIQVFVRWVMLTSGCRPKTNIWVFEEYPDGAIYIIHSARSLKQKILCDMSRFLCITQKI